MSGFDPFADAYGPDDVYGAHDDPGAGGEPAAATPEDRPRLGRRAPVSLGEIAARGTGGAGIGCPECGCPEWRVVETRPGPGYVRRRRECDHCGKRITTTERAVGGSADRTRPYR